jgi:ubiquinone/menaquinone biosynthesis C-methylase UbiE
VTPTNPKSRPKPESRPNPDNTTSPDSTANPEVAPNPESRTPNHAPEGWHGWDEYAPFYDWENARTLGRRDVPFWRRVAADADGPVLELGCGTGRVSLPLARAGIELVGIDRSEPMLERAIRRAAQLRRANPESPTAPTPRIAATPRTPNPESRPSRASGRPEFTEGRVPTFVRGDIRALPFRRRAFAMVLAPYGILQSLIRPRDLTAALESVARVLPVGATFGIDLVPDVPKWREYTDRVQMNGRVGGGQLTLIESVRQDPRRHLTTFEQRYVVRKGPSTTEHRFDLTFRTLSVEKMTVELERAGFTVSAVLGDYRGRPWDDRADVWIILARKVRSRHQPSAISH